MADADDAVDPGVPVGPAARLEYFMESFISGREADWIDWAGGADGVEFTEFGVPSAVSVFGALLGV